MQGFIALRKEIHDYSMISAIIQLFDLLFNDPLYPHIHPAHTCRTYTAHTYPHIHQKCEKWHCHRERSVHQLFRTQYTCFELDTVNIDWWICINVCLVEWCRVHVHPPLPWPGGAGLRGSGGR